ncbi:helix-turn-helix transcriptional regulator [Phreatobacter aquaticus]|uniref:Helix-turn-helix transcriptional regulator n=1 Tax=Phreatobacter aquaticus TaxID=2570229 RepID=A0A4D7QQM1_9HYPH|nr:metalloregulator ArsR/SmtB family transcription factor [Phreatobacter aquaticus]QCK88721.1 helix-turn-helix transcriptional regulator [Phreatobacter aquaticus]
MDMIVIATRLEALGNPTRLAIYRALVRAGAAGLPVGKLQERLAIPASTLSHHLAKLCGCDLVSQTRESTVLRCRANYQVMRDLVGALEDECCADAACGADVGTDAAVA